ncbi:MAG TPA: N-acetyltransferase [Gammaproteobacteria bacterium]|nr:N-acetyltransferase [Gammaproteobacteria bacterium]
MDYEISTDKSKLNVEAIHDYLCHQSYWAKGRSLERVKKSIENSICYGLYDDKNNMIGFARVLTDYVVFAYLMDLFVFEDYRGKGLGKKLVKHIMEETEFQVRLWFLGTADAHGLYEKFGFSALDNPDRFMFKRDTNYC